MPKRIAVHTLILTREGKRITVTPGTPIDLTADEVKELNALNAIRLPVNETTQVSTEDEGADKPKGEETPPAAGKKASGKGKEEEL